MQTTLVKGRGFNPTISMNIELCKPSLDKGWNFQVLAVASDVAEIKSLLSVAKPAPQVKRQQAVAHITPQSVYLLSDTELLGLLRRNRVATSSPTRITESGQFITQIKNLKAAKPAWRKGKRKELKIPYP